MAPGPGRTVLFTQTHPSALVRLDLATGAGSPIPLDGEPFDLVQGPDHAVWFTDPGRGRIGRVSLDPGAGAGLDRGVRYFALPPGCRPEEIVTSQDGRLFFTLAGQERIGAIRARAVEAAPAPPAPAQDPSWAVPVYQPRPERRRAEVPIPKSGRKAAKPGPPAAPEPQEEKHPPQPSPASPPMPKPAPGPASPPADPAAARKALAAQGIRLAPGTTEAILAKHGLGQRAGKSQFAAAFSTPAGLEALLAQRLGETEVGLILDAAYGRWGEAVTFCRQPGVGTWFNGGAQVPTDRFKVVTQWCRGLEGAFQEILNAYPVR